MSETKTSQCNLLSLLLSITVFEDTTDSDIWTQVQGFQSSKFDHPGCCKGSWPSFSFINMIIVRLEALKFFEIQSSAHLLWKLLNHVKTAVFNSRSLTISRMMMKVAQHACIDAPSAFWCGLCNSNCIDGYDLSGALYNIKLTSAPEFQFFALLRVNDPVLLINTDVEYCKCNRHDHVMLQLDTFFSISCHITQT